MGRQWDGRQLLARDLDTERVLVRVVVGLDGEPGPGGRGPDQLDDGPEGREGAVSPVPPMKVNTRWSMRFHLRFPGGEWQMVLTRPVGAEYPSGQLTHEPVLVSEAAEDGCPS